MNHKVAMPAYPEWRQIESAPRDGQRVLLLFKSVLPARSENFAGIPFVGQWGGKYYEWSFAAPVGMGGFPDEWMEGWLPLPVSNLAAISDQPTRQEDAQP